MRAAKTTSEEEPWASLLTKAGSELCDALSLSPFCVVEARDALPSGRLGACIPLVGSLQVQLVMLSTNTGLRSLAEALMCHEEGDEELTGADVKDAIRELSNQFAGLAKRQLSKRGDLRIGLPMFVRGIISPPPGRRLYVQDVLLGKTEVTLGLFSSDG